MGRWYNVPLNKEYLNEHVAFFGSEIHPGMKLGNKSRFSGAAFESRVRTESLHAGSRTRLSPGAKNRRYFDGHPPEWGSKSRPDTVMFIAQNAVPVIIYDKNYFFICFRNITRKGHYDLSFGKRTLKCRAAFRTECAISNINLPRHLIV